MSLPVFWNDEKAEALAALARRAGAATLQLRAAGGLNTQNKNDGSPVTCADHASQSIILEGLRLLTPAIPIVAEENESQPDVRASEACWFVDPLDGTREYVRGGDEYSVNIGLLWQGRPAIGLVYAPALDDMVYADPKQIWRQVKEKKEALERPATPLQRAPRLVTSAREGKRLPLENWVTQGRFGHWRICHSAYKLALVAGGDEDLFVRAGITYEWDTCAGHAILRALGGHILTPDGQELTYDKPDYRNGDYLCFRPDAPQPLVDSLLDDLRALGSPNPPKGLSSFE